jgi:hypothetical protein
MFKKIVAGIFAAAFGVAVHAQTPVGPPTAAATQNTPVTVQGTATVQGNQSNNSDSVAATSTNIGAVAYPYLVGGSSNWNRWRDVVVAGDASSFGIGSVGAYLFNGTGWDRARGSATAGMQVSPNAYPFGATAITANNSGTTTAVAATLPGTAGKTTYICGYNIAQNATAATFGGGSITGTISGTMALLEPVAASPAVAVTQDRFNPCIPASGQNVAIVVNSVNPGTGGNVDVYAYGYQQ